MIEQPDHWESSMRDYYDRNIKPLVPITCQLPDCDNLTVQREDFCPRHLLEQNQAYEEWLDWKDEQ